MLTVVRPLRPHDRDTEVAVTVVHWWQRYSFEWPRFLLAWCAAFHILAGLVLGLAPYDQVLTEGTRPVLDIASRYVWALVFVAIGVAVTLLRHHRPFAVQIAVWVSVLGVGGMWLTAFSLAVLEGSGSALGVVVWPFLYGPWAILAFRLSLGKR